MTGQHPRVWDWRTYLLNYGPESSTTRHVLLTLSCYMNSAGDSCFPSVETLCEATQLSNRTVITHLKRAENEGWIEITKHGYGDKRWRRNEYRANVPEKVVKEVHDVGQKGSEPDDKGGEPHAEGGEGGSHYLSNTSSSNSSSSGSARARKELDFLEDEYRRAYGQTIRECISQFSPTSIDQLISNQWGGYRQGRSPTSDLIALSQEYGFRKFAAAVVITGNEANTPNVRYLSSILDSDFKPKQNGHAKDSGRNTEHGAQTDGRTGGVDEYAHLFTGG